MVLTENNMSKTCLILATVLLFITANTALTYGNDDLWMEVYSGDEKVGYIHRVLSGSKQNQKIREQTFLKLNLLGKETEMEINSQYLLKNSKISSFDYSVRSSSISLNLKGRINGNKLEIVDIGNNTKHEYLLKHEYIVPSMIPDYIYQRGLNEGEAYELYLFDPVNIYTGYDPSLLKADVKIQGTEKITTKSGTYTAKKVLVNFLGAENALWITGDGTNVLEKFEPSLRAEISSRKNALKNNSKAFDITEKTSIASNIYIHDPREVRKMVAILDGVNDIEGLALDDGNYQSMTENVLTITSPSLPDTIPYKIPYQGDIYGRYLESSVLIQKDDPSIVRQAKKITHGELNPVLAVKLINDWTYENIEKIPTVSIPSAVEVLKTMKGDCNEHAVLFAALARASGIPVKVILGVVYLEGRFYYHAWNEVFLGRWIPVDSTFGQIPSDATHIKLIEGDISKSPEILKVVGKMKLNIVETD